MALSRCCQCGRPTGRKKVYVGYVYPVGYPGTALICGKSTCTNPGLIWLEQVEADSFLNSQKVTFSGDSNIAKMQADSNRGFTVFSVK